MATIAYDKTVYDFIEGLDATGHVTHDSYQKKSVTYHHNGARLSLQGILDVWKVREASAHFDVDAYGSVGQYVRVNEYAWAVGNTLGNQESISIEMCNLTLDPTWEVAEVTWKEAARLSGWLHAKVIGTRPTRTTSRKHKDWKATICSGPYIDTVFDTMIGMSQDSYDYFATVETTQPPPPVVVTPDPTPVILPTDPVYEVGPITIKPDPALPTPVVIPALPTRLITPVPGLPLSTVADYILDGKWGGWVNLETRLNQLGYDSEAVRKIIFERLRHSGDLTMVKRTFRRSN